MVCSHDLRPWHIEILGKKAHIQLLICAAKLIFAIECAPKLDLRSYVHLAVLQNLYVRSNVSLYLFLKP